MSDPNVTPVKNVPDRNKMFTLEIDIVYVLLERKCLSLSDQVSRFWLGVWGAAVWLSIF